MARSRGQSPPRGNKGGRMWSYNEHPCCREENNELRARIAEYQELIKAKDNLLTAYRVGDQRLADRALTKIEKIEAALKGETNE